ncbi:DUF2938 domain-containing protein [Leptonema illini]|uniref:DUF2938 domain-containing protein n=1 Tax=Leptonema illini DSM 21528 TaxID=929563 RepID=H2CLH1_9LEPT|nr:DUF2938 domain-containing protein [Leptonema illini]EHQ04582.1 hypothetical protein Lepil_4104 [Leptonema illini DSM 21528]
MNITTAVMVQILAVGAGATLTMDIWRFLLLKVFGINSLDLSLLGRWVGHLPHGRFFHAKIAGSERIKGELLLGWITHYGIGIGFAMMLSLFWGAAWFASPVLLPALTVGLATVLAPWFIMQPAMGLGVTAANAPSPNAVRLRNLAIHLVYGLGLYVSALALNWLIASIRFNL